MFRPGTKGEKNLRKKNENRISFTLGVGRANYMFLNITPPSFHLGGCEGGEPCSLREEYILKSAQSYAQGTNWKPPGV